MRIIVTGGNSGLGKETATALAAQGHQIVVAARDVEKSERVAAGIDGEVAVAQLDLGDLTSVRKFAESVDEVDVLVNNAGVLGLPPRRTVDGFEMHMGINYLGHYALTCLLSNRITTRVVSVTSMSHMFSRLHLEDLNWQTRRYFKWSAYGESKLAVMLFTSEMARRGMPAVAVDPGGADTDIVRYDRGFLRWSSNQWWVKDFPQSAYTAARSTVIAATRDLPPGTYLAPTFLQFGKPRVPRSRKKTKDPRTARRLWELSAELTECDWLR